MAARLGSFVYRHRWPVIVAWIVIFTGTALFAPRVSSVLKGGGYSIPASQSDKAFEAIRSAYGYRALAFTAVFQPSRGADVRTALQVADRFRSNVRSRLGRRLDAQSAVVSGDRRIVFVRIFTGPLANLGIPLTRNIRRLVPHSARVQTFVTGASATFYDMEQVSDSDLRQMEIVTFPIALAILLIIFGTVLGAFVPVSMGPLTVTSALASIFLLGHTIDMSIFVLNTASMLGLGVAIDYSLFMVQRFREELRRAGVHAETSAQSAEAVEQALITTVRTSGVAITASAATVAIGFLGMTLFRVTMLTSLGVGGSVVVGISLCCALTFLPAILAVLGPNINRFSVLPRRVSTEVFWHKLATFVMKRPWRVIIAATAVIVVLAIPAVGLRVGVPGPDILPRSSESRVGNNLLAHHIAIANQSPVLVVLHSRHPLNDEANKVALLDVAGKICDQSVVAGIGPAVANSASDVKSCRVALHTATSRTTLRTLSSRHTLLVSIYLRVPTSSARAEAFVQYIRHIRPPEGVRVLVGGQTAGQLDFDTFIYNQFPYAILFVVLAIFCTLAIAFRSILLPIKAVLMNALSVLAAYGATVFVFQDGNFQSLFGFTATGALDSIVPVFIFCVLFGISTDYEVFLLARIREEYRISRNNERSVAIGLERTGRMITSAALIMVVIFGAFSFAKLVVIKELGFAMAVGVLVDSTLVRALLVPAAMRILGRWNWWPGKYAVTEGDGIPLGREHSGTPSAVPDH